MGVEIIDLLNHTVQRRLRSQEAQDLLKVKVPILSLSFCPCLTPSQVWALQGGLLPSSPHPRGWVTLFFSRSLASSLSLLHLVNPAGGVRPALVPPLASTVTLSKPPTHSESLFPYPLFRPEGRDGP